MDAVIDVAMDDGYTIASTSDADGTIVCDPRKMLDGILTEKITGNDWGMQSTKATYNRFIQFSARVSKEGAVALKTLVMVLKLDGPVDVEKSEKLARYYEKRILKALRTRPPKLL